ncbi:hypothetical protein [Streptomyces sp. NRRL B-24720]|uniref:hypothetical protein n=1 Tax=Streptomyces sp. NRRL B-24720 TaxID=1476876 RepID=UPI000B2293CB|nr:hypothetical protein [Streptomyces sp. NRRL B-24720]
MSTSPDPLAVLRERGTWCRAFQRPPTYRDGAPGGHWSQEGEGKEAGQSLSCG